MRRARVLIRTCILLRLRSGRAHSHQLRRALDLRLGPWRAVAPAQVRTTLRRLVRQGQVEEAAPDQQGRVFFDLSSDGRTVADHLARQAWLAAAEITAHAADERVARLVRTLEQGGPWQLRAAARRDRQMLEHRLHALSGREFSPEATPLRNLVEALLVIEIEWLRELVARPDSELRCPPDHAPGDRNPGTDAHQRAKNRLE